MVDTGGGFCHFCPPGFFRWPSLSPGRCIVHARIIVGLKSSIQLYDLNGSLLGETDLPAKIYGINDQNITFFFPDKDSLFYGDIQNGFLLDILSEQLEVIKQMKYVVGFDQDTREFILNDMHKKGDEGALSIEYFKYHTLNEIRKLAEE